MDVLGLTLIEVIHSTVHNDIENIWKVHLCLTLVKVFFNTYSQVTFTLIVRFSGLPKPLYAVQV